MAQVLFIDVLVRRRVNESSWEAVAENDVEIPIRPAPGGGPNRKPAVADYLKEKGQDGWEVACSFGDTGQECHLVLRRPADLG